jgi:hypothetical protein
MDWGNGKQNILLAAFIFQAYNVNISQYGDNANNLNNKNTNIENATLEALF